MTEEWRGVPGFPGYEVSDLGRVRSLDRAVTYNRVDQYSGRTLTITKKVRGRILAPGTVASGHQFVVLGRKHGRFIHTLVLLAFVGPAPPRHECCHWDDDARNNALTNLRWGTRKENVADYLRNYGIHAGARRYHVD